MGLIMIIVAAVQSSQVKNMIEGLNRNGSTCNSLGYITDVWLTGLEVRLSLLAGNTTPTDPS